MDSAQDRLIRSLTERLERLERVQTVESIQAQLKASEDQIWGPIRQESRLAGIGKPIYVPPPPDRAPAARYSLAEPGGRVFETEEELDALDPNIWFDTPAKLPKPKTR